jgi:hypothetical protein
MAFMDTLAKGAQEYCRVRITFGAIIGAVIAVILIIAAFMLPSRMGDTSKYVSVDGTVKSAVVVSPKEGKNRLTISYVVDGKTYTTTQLWTGDKDSQIGQTRKVLYDPTNPSRTTLVKNIENKLSWVSVLCAVLIAGWSIFSYKFRDNPIFCGGTIASDAISIFSSN